MAKKDQRFDDGALVRRDFRATGRRISPRKMAQLCAQIRRALQLAVLGSVDDEALTDLEVDTVEPCADPGRVRVVFLYHGDPRISEEEIHQRVEAARSIWTSEVARAIHRKRVPELVLEVRRAGEDEEEEEETD